MKGIMSYCTNCGSELVPGARFCTACGAPVASVADAPAAAPYQTAPHQALQQPASQQQPQHQVPLPQQGTHHRQAPAARTAAGAFASVPVSDYVRDGLTIFLLLTSMFMVWTYGSTSLGSVAATRIDVILITLVSLLSVAIPYLWRSGVFGQGWGYRRTQQARLAANAPYFVLVLVYLILELIHKQGLGPAVAFGLAGAVLAAQPRRAELGSAAADASTNKRWGIALIGLAVLVAVLSVIQFIEMMTILAMVPGTQWANTLATVILAAANAALLIWAAVGVSRGSNARRFIGIGVGAAGLCMGLLALIPTVTVVTLIFHAYSPGLSIFFWPAFGALAAAPSLALITTSASSQDSDAVLARTRTITILAIIGMLLVAVVAALALISNTAFAGFGIATNTVPWVVVIFLAVVGAVGGFVAKAALKQHTRQSYILSAGYAAALFILGLVIVILSATSYMPAIGTLGLLTGFALPVALVLSMFGSTAQRQAFRTSGHAGPGGFTFDNVDPAGVRQESTTTGAGHERTAASQTEAQVHGVGTQGDVGPEHSGNTQVQVDAAPPAILAEAGNPAAQPARLYEIAAEYPSARSLIAANPAAYPALLTWLGEQQDPEIDAALAQRRG